MPPQVPFDSPFYPYEKIQTGFSGFRGAEQIPYKIIQYLLDLPDANGYEPADDNTRPRVRLMKYLWYDGANPLEHPLPTPKEKLSLLFNGDEPVLNTDELKSKHPKGYRIFPQVLWGQSQKDAQSTLKIYMDRSVALTDFKTSLGITFEIMTNAHTDSNTRTDAYSRTYDMEQCLLEALHGVNIVGVGVLDFARGSHGDAGSNAIYDTSGTNVGRELHMSVLWMDSNAEVTNTYQ